MKHLKLTAAVLIGALLFAAAPKPMALADGAASTRNIILTGAAAAATLIIINHNKKVHQRYAEDAQKQAALASQRDDAQAAARQYKLAYEHESEVVANMKNEVAIQQNQIAQLKAQVASINPPGSNFVATKPVAQPIAHGTNAKPAQVVAYGWGDF
jgi:hypothetical protein